NVGVGTTSPWARFSVDASNLGASPAFAVGSSTATRFIITNAGNMGLGTTSPASLLSVHGNGFFSGNIAAANITATGTINVTSTATSTFASGINLTGGCFAINGACIGYTVQLAAIYATSSVGTTTVNFTGAAGSAPSFSNATLTLPKNTTKMQAEIWGAGGGGSGNGAGYGGGGGGYARKLYSSLAANYYYNVGSGGIGTSNSSAGANGGNTNFGNGSATTTANGGVGGGTTSGGAGGSASGGDVNIQGGGGNGFVSTQGVGGSGGGGGGGGGTTLSINGAPFGGGGAGIGGTAGNGGAGGLVLTIYATSSSNGA